MNVRSEEELREQETVSAMTTACDSNEKTSNFRKSRFTDVLTGAGIGLSGEIINAEAGQYCRNYQRKEQP